MGSTLTGKNKLLGEQILFLELTPSEMEGKNDNGRVASPV